MIWFLLVKMIGKTRRAVITVNFFDWVVLKGLIMSSFSIVFISRLAGFFLTKYAVLPWFVKIVMIS